MNSSSLMIPASRGHMGDWIFYSAIMPLREAGKRVSLIRDVHKEESLSCLLQRNLRGKREKEIAEYLNRTDDRFFNSLVLSVYGGVPQWHPATISNKENHTSNITGEIGVLEFDGDEQIIPIDGQHRIAGIKKLIKMLDSNEIEANDDYPIYNDCVPVIFISHQKDEEEQMVRTRRLFTTLNKYAKPVNKYETIALDEDDPMAIVTRWLVENDDRFSVPKIKTKGSMNVVDSDVCLTSIENLYSVLRILFSKVKQKVSIKTLVAAKRPSDKELNDYHDYAQRFFDCIASKSKPLDNYFGDKDDFGAIAQSQRKKGNLIFRPVGLRLIANLLSRIDGESLEEKFNLIYKVPMNIHKSPYQGILITEQGKIIEGNEPKVRSLLLSALGVDLNKTEIRSARTGIAMIHEVPLRKVNEEDLPKNLDELKNISK